MIVSRDKKHGIVYKFQIMSYVHTCHNISLSTCVQCISCFTCVGTALQAVHKDLGKVDFSTPEGLLAGLGYAITRPGHCYHFQQANLASERSGVSGVHQWSVMLPTSARVAQEVYEPLIGIQYPMLCSCKNGRRQIGTGSIRLKEKKPTGLRFVHWIHQDPREATG